ncbi:MAG: hypothetical protein FGM52_13965, partial [Mycobacterium sp.]|nr:hypothetical protein [Mycobacterium sp.]
MGRHSIPSGEPSPDESSPADDSPRTRRAEGDWQGRRRRLDAGRRGVSLGVIAAVAGVVVLLGGVI